MFTQSQHSFLYFEITVLTLSKGLLNISEGLLTMSKLRFSLVWHLITFLVDSSTNPKSLFTKS